MRKRFFRPVQDNRVMYMVGMGAMSTRFFFDIFTVWVVKYIGQAIDSNDYELIRTTILWYCFFFVLYYVWKYIIRKAGRAVSRYVFAKYFWKQQLKKFFSLENTYVERMGTGRSISLLQDGITNWIEALLMIQYETPNILIKIGFTLVLLWQIGRLYVLGFFVLCVIVQAFVSRINSSYLTPLRGKRKAIGVESSRHFVRMLMNKQEITHTQLVDKEIEEYLKKVQTQQDLNFSITHYIFFMFNIPLIAVQSLSIIAFVYAYMSLRDGTFSLGLFSALIAMVGYLGQLMLKSTEAVKSLGDQMIHIEKLRSYMDEGGEVDYTQGTTFVLKNGTIEVNNLSFAYTYGANIFTNFSVHLAGGKKTALVGMSGSGKTTLIKLLAGYMLPDAGSVYVDGQALATLSLQSYYAHIGYLTQDPSVFDGTIRENLAYGISGEHDSWSSEHIDSIIRLAKCEFMHDLPEGLDTEIGERGIKLSGGQRQRLAIAKILLKNPKILFLDEPTSSLDSFAEEAVTEAMNNLFVGRTVIIIAHRLQTVKHADEIIVLEQGRIVERGTHDGLLQTGGYYARMLELQSGF